MFSINDKKIIEYEKDLKAFAHRAYPFATKKTLNDAAFAAQKTAKLNVKSSMVERNKFTSQSIQVDMVRGLNVSRQESVIGSIADYMETQEFGGTKSKRGKRGVAIPTSYASGQGENSRPRKKLPTKPNKLQNIRLKHKRTKGGRRQKNLIAVKNAASSGNKYVYLDLGRREGLFKVIGGKKRPRVKMVHSLEHQSVNIPRNPWLVPAVIATERKIPKLYIKALEFQLKKHGLFK